MAEPRYEEVGVGTRLPGLTHTLRRGDLVVYAGASGDFNPIHWSERAAAGAGLPAVVAHGMLTLGVALRVLTEWAGRDAVLECATRFAAPVLVPDTDEGVEITAGAVVSEKLGDGRVRVDLTVRCGGEKVLARPRAVVRLR
ncbi:MaoC/PaaZ C-terminal domain-containing protein [Microbispora hainanensis]|uniref:MaoC/PaaZ C-terminal domain-containing protein n=1 Tax=Microbispora hainanensis TaxID=568844 RepID=A0ABZ1SUC3_9ACTN|nr:MaoC/PaaZ C-terminal domain-containing protein [Microbispora hainanensis]